jgi:small conductance mechanosensitive channel
MAEYSWRVLAAGLILVFGSLVSLAVGSVLRKILLHSQRSQLSMRSNIFFISRFSAFGVLVVTFSLVLTALGLAGPVIGFMVTVGVALGLAADSFSGFRILSFRPFSVGDVIEIRGEGVIGQVVQTGMSQIVLVTADNTQVYVPNRKLLDRLVVNHSARGIDALSCFQFVLESTKEIGLLEEEIQAVLKSVAESRRGSHGMVWITLIEADSVTFRIRIPAMAYHAEREGSEFLKLAKARFDQAGIGIRSLRAMHDGTGAASEVRG